MHWRRLLTIFGVLLLIIGGLIGWQIYRGFFHRHRLDVTQLQRADHLLFRGERREDGSVDYIQRVQELSFLDVAYDQNYGVAILELAPDDSELRPETRARYQVHLPFREENDYRFRSWADLAKELGSDVSTIASVVRSTTPDSFAPDFPDRKLLRGVLKLQSPTLDRLREELERRPGYAMPLLPWQSDQTGGMVAIILPYAQIQRDFGRWLVARSNQRIVDGELQEAWSDTRAIYQLGERQSQGICLVEVMVALYLHTVATDQTIQLLNTPGLTPDLLQTMEQELPSLDRLRPWTEVLDLGERAMILDMMDRMTNQDLAMQEFVDSTGATVPEGMNVFPWGWVDSKQIADRWNQRLDKVIDLAESGNAVAARDSMEQLGTTPVSDPQWLLARAVVGAAPREEVTTAAQRFFLSVSRVYNNLMDATVRMEAKRRLVRLAVAARRYEFQHGRLPSGLAELDALVNSQDQQDPYSQQPMSLRWDSEADPPSLLIQCPPAGYKVPPEPVFLIPRSPMPSPKPEP